MVPKTFKAKWFGVSPVLEDKESTLHNLSAQQALGKQNVSTKLHVWMVVVDHPCCALRFFTSRVWSDRCMFPAISLHERSLAACQHKTKRSYFQSTHLKFRTSINSYLKASLSSYEMKRVIAQDFFQSLQLLFENIWVQSRVGSHNVLLW
jgi:hypothetical protein